MHIGEFSVIFVPKTGSRTLADVLGMALGHYQASTSPDNFRVAMVRNPYHRLRSAFDYGKYSQCGHDGIDFQQYVMERMYHDGGCRPLCYWLDRPMGWIGRYENLEFYVRELCGLLGRPCPEVLPRHHRIDPAYHSTYDAAMKRIVFEDYREDFERFGYGA